MKYYIYMLTDPRTKQIRYVGQTTNIYKRYTRHCTYFGESNHRTCWLKQLNSLGLEPIMEVIEECDESNWVEREQYWIRYYREQGCDLVNATDGGEGFVGLFFSDTHRANMSLSHRGKKLAKDHKQKISYSLLGNNRATGFRHSQEFCKINSEKRLGELNPRAKLTAKDVIDIKIRIANGESSKDIALIYGITYQNINNIKNGKSWGWLK